MNDITQLRQEIGEKYKVYDRNCSYEPQQSCSKIDSINSRILRFDTSIPTLSFL